MITRRAAVLAAIPLLAIPKGAGHAVAVSGPAPARNCGDPGGRFIACEALQDALPLLPGGGRCPICGGLHRASAER